MSEENWNEVSIEKPKEEEKVDFEVESEETSPSNVEPKVEEKREEPEKKETPELEGVETKGAQKRIRQLIKQRKDREDQIVQLIKQNEELTTKAKTRESEFNNLTKLNLDATEKQVKDKLVLARNAFTAAQEEGNAEKILQAQEFLNDAQNDLKSVSVTKQQYKEPRVTQEQAQQLRYPIQPKPDPRAQEWATQNDWFGEDKIRTAAALSIDADLKEEGFNPIEEDYYIEINNRLKEAFPHKYTNTNEEIRQQEASPAQVVSGVSRSSPGSNKKVKLSKEDVRLANKWNIPLEQYAQEKLKANQAEGEYTTINTQRGGN